MLDISVLGPVAVRRDRVAVPIPGGKTAELLVRLALDAGRPVSADRLLDELWAGAPQPRDLRLQRVALRRRAVGDPGLIDGAYRLAVHP